MFVYIAFKQIQIWLDKYIIEVSRFLFSLNYPSDDM